MSGILGTQAYKNFFGNPVSYTQGGITASMPAGSLVGSLASSFLADKYSRKVALQISCVIWILGSILQCASQNIAMLCAGRAVAGICVGIASSVVPVYQSEIAPKEIRGRVVSLQQWAITWGILIQFFVQYGASHVGDGPEDPFQPEAAFRIPWGLQMIPGFVLLIGLFFCPYSPRWLAAQDRWEEAIQVLARLHGGGDINHPKVLAQYQEIEEALRYEREQAISSFKALVAPRMLKRVFLGMSIQAWSQLCGMNIMVGPVSPLRQRRTRKPSRTLQATTGSISTAVEKSLTPDFADVYVHGIASPCRASRFLTGIPSQTTLYTSWKVRRWPRRS